MKTWLRAVGALGVKRLCNTCQPWCAAILLALSLLSGAPAHAAALINCTPVDLTLNITPTADILVPAQANRVIYQGTVTASRTCSVDPVINDANNIVVGTNMGGGTPLTGAGSWLRIRLVAHSGTITRVNGTCAMNAQIDNIGTSQSFLRLNFGGSTGLSRCTVTYSYDFEIYVDQPAAASVTAFPVLTPTSNRFYNRQGWVVWEDNGANAGYSLPALSVNFKPVGCTLSPTSVLLTLPAATTSELSAAGAVAQPRPFDIVLTSCLSLPSPYAVTATWSFGQLGTNASVIANSAASGPAANVGIQLLDSNMVPITNSGTSTLATISGNGTYRATHFARYFSAGAATAGNVQGMATFNLTYQ